MSNLAFSYVLFFALIVGLTYSSSSSSSFISYDVFKSQAVTGRRLFQQTKDCPVDFEHQNYTILTSQCKGPQYNKNICCTAFKRFACPFATEINDQQSVCSETMFSYINLYGKYPPALFSSMCVEGTEGLDCEETLKVLAQEKNHSSSLSRPSMFMIVFLVSLFGLFFC